MRSFTRKNIEYTNSAIGDSFYKLLNTDGTNNHIQLLRAAFDTPKFRNAAKALTNLAVRWRKNEWEAVNHGWILNIKDFINEGELINNVVAICTEDYVINSDGINSQDLFASPQANKTIDFASIKINDHVQFDEIENDYINTRFFNPDKIKNELKKAPFELDKATHNIPDTVLKNAAGLIILMQVLSVVKVRSRYENLYGFEYPNPVNTPNIKLNCFVYGSSVPVGADVIALIGNAITESNKVYVAPAKPCTTLRQTVLAVQETATQINNYMVAGTLPVKAGLNNCLNNLRAITTMIGKADAVRAVDALSSVLDTIINGNEPGEVAAEVKSAISKAVKVATTINGHEDSQNASGGALDLHGIIEKIKRAFNTLKDQFGVRNVINSEKFKLDPTVSKFDCLNAGTDIMGAQNPVITALAPNHVNFTNLTDVARWTRQNIATHEEAAGYSIIPFDEGEELVNRYINNDRGLIKRNTIERQGYSIVKYLEYHYNTGAKQGYRPAKKNLLLIQGAYCGFCETPFCDGSVADIEHKLPKSIFPTQALNWSNFVLSCKTCNSVFKNQKHINGASVIDMGTVGYLTNGFLTGGGKDYLACKNKAEQEVVWPDKRHVPLNGHHDFLPFGAIVSSTPIVNLAAVTHATYAYVHTQALPAGVTNRIDFRRLTNSPDVDDVKVIYEKGGNLPPDVGTVGVGLSAVNLINICGLNDTGKSYWNDQRIASRTRAWLNAVKQVKIISEFSIDKFEKLYTFYRKHLHVANINYTPAAPGLSMIKELRDPSAAANYTIKLDTIKGDLSVATAIAGEKVDIDLATSNVTTNNVNINGNIPVNNNFVFNQGRLTGEIKEAGGTRTITGSIKLQTQIPGYNAADSIILFKDVEISAAAVNPAIIQIKDNEGIISGAVNPLQEWDNNRADLLQLIEQAGAILKDYIWDNITDMVRFGGYYSTWVQVFHQNTKIIGNEVIPYGLELVKRLEVKKLESREDPFQFHGTDTEEIMACLF